MGYDDTAWPIQTKTGRQAGEVRLIMHYANANKLAASYAHAAQQPHTHMYSAPPSHVASYPPAAAYQTSSPYPAYPPHSAAYAPTPYPPLNQLLIHLLKQVLTLQLLRHLQHILLCLIHHHHTTTLILQVHTL